jgi:hypothetical protein
MYFGFSNSIVARFENKRKVGCKISQVFKLLITSSGHFSDRTFFVTLAMTRFFSLLSVINVDSLIVCLQVTHLSFIILLCSGKLPLRCAAKTGVMQKKRNGYHPTPLPIILTNLISNKTSVEASPLPFLF